LYLGKLTLVSECFSLRDELWLTDVRSNPRHDNLLLAGRLDRLTELRVVPRVDFALALNERRVGVHFEDGFWQWAVGALLSGRAHYDGEVEEFADAGVRDHGVVVEGGVEVSGTAGGWC
jgi:hypothetical protein